MREVWASLFVRIALFARCGVGESTATLKCLRRHAGAVGRGFSFDAMRSGDAQSDLIEERGQR